MFVTVSVFLFFFSLNSVYACDADGLVYGAWHVLVCQTLSNRSHLYFFDLY